MRRRFCAICPSNEMFVAAFTMASQLVNGTVMNAEFSKIAVVGGGIIGLTSAVALQETFHRAQIVILAEAWTPNLTSNIAAGVIFPYVAGKNTPAKLIHRLLGDTIEFYRNLMRNNPESGKIGISLVNGYQLYREENFELPDFPEIPEIRRMGKWELGALFPNEYRSGFAFTTYVVECTQLIPYLMDKFREKGGKLVTEKISSLNSLVPQYDLIINCTGLSSRYLSDVQDQSLEAVRGQVIRVKAPWIRHSFVTDDCHIIPNQNSVLLGGTKDKGNYSLIPDPQISQRILERCTELIPSLKRAEKIGDFVGLRPYRQSIRIEADPVQRKVIHNYGHGGSGVTLCWGSALEVVKLAQNILTQNNLKSKL